MTLKFDNAGYVYLLSNESLKGLKIGYTKNSPHDRSDDLYTTGVPTPFVVEDFWFVEDAPLLEAIIHARLVRERIGENREFFRISVEKAISVAIVSIDDMRNQLWEKAQLYKKNFNKTDNKPESKPTPAGNDEAAPVSRPLVTQFDYSNPKFVEMMKLLKTSRPLLTVEEIAKGIKISPAGVEKLITMMGKQTSVMLYSREEERVKKYSMALQFGVPHLILLAERYPNLKDQILELQPLFERPKQKFNNDYKRKQTSNTSNNQTPRTFIEEKLNRENLDAAGVKGDLTAQGVSKTRSLLDESKRAYKELLEQKAPEQRRTNKPT